MPAKEGGTGVAAPNAAHKQTNHILNRRLQPRTGASSEKTADPGGKLTVWTITSQVPERLTKSYRLSGGELTKIPGGQVARGCVQRTEVDGLEGFARHLAGLETNQALTYGGPESDGVLLSEKEMTREGHPPGTVTRTKRFFAYEARPGILMLDYDPADGREKLGPTELVDVVRSAAPGLEDAAMLWWTSSSSHIVNGDTDEDLTGQRGQRLYIAVQDASDIPRATAALTTKLWAADHGFFAVSRSGALLERTVFDTAVWQPERLDFAAGGACVPPLEQRRGSPKLVRGEVEIVDTRAALPDPESHELTAAQRAKESLRRQMSGDARRQRDRWVKAKLDELSGEAKQSATTLHNLETTVRRAVEHGVLSGEYPIHYKDETGQHCVATIGEVLDERERWHRTRCFDPIEPEYRGHSEVGIILTLDGVPKLFSHAHGGRSYRLVRQPARVLIAKGRRIQAVDATVDYLREDPEFYDFGDLLVHVQDGTMMPLSGAGLEYYLGRTVQFYRQQLVKDEEAGEKVLTDVDEDVPTQVANQIESQGARRRLKPLRDIVTAPTIRPDGTVISRPGYDQRTGIMLHASEAADVPSNPSMEQCAEAVRVLLEPFREFPLASSEDWGGLLAALLTAVARPAFPTAPAFAFDAPEFGTGKTLLAQCVGALRLGYVPPVFPTVRDNDEEVRKRLFAEAMAGSKYLLWDNILGTFNSAALASYLTSPTVSDRRLGESRTLSAPFNALVVLSGNNLALTGDLPRRVVKVRIVPDCERPSSRHFDFCPLAMTTRNRHAMAAAACTIIRGYTSRGVFGERASGSLGSFEAWEAIVRQAVCWVSREIDPLIGDPLELVKAVQTASPEEEATADLARALHECFGGERFTAKEVVQRAGQCAFDEKADAARETLREALQGLSADGRMPSIKSVGRMLMNRRDRIVEGLQLVQVPLPGRSSAWRISATT